MNKGYISCIMLGIMVLLFFVVSLFIGSVSIPVSETFRILIGEESVKPSWQYIVIESRLPQAVTAMLCGASLAVCGLILQTAFRNPLAGPSIFGVNSGAGLGVALVMLFFGGSVSAGTVSIGGFMAVLLAAFAGDLFTYCVTSVQLALAYPSESGGVLASTVKFLGVFAPTQLPLAVIEGILTVIIVIALETYARPELKAVGFMKEAK